MHTAICAFDDRARAEEAMQRLLQAGFPRHDVHIEHKHTTGEGDAARKTEKRETHDRGALSSFGHFFASLLGRDNPSGHADTYAQHVERGGCVVVVDADDAAQAQRAQALLQEMQGADVHLLHRDEQQPLRDIARWRDEPAGMVERSRVAFESWSPTRELAGERALAAERLDALGGPKLRDPEVEHPPGLRYADKDKPLG
jgi:hypothetical protein